MPETVCVQIKMLYLGLGETLSFTEIRFSSEEGVEYYDLFDTMGELVCMDGESCNVLATSSDSVLLQNFNGEEQKKFFLSKAEYDIAVFI